MISANEKGVEGGVYSFTVDNITPPYVCLDCLNRAWRKDDPCPRCGGTMLMHVRSLESKPGKGWCETLEKERKRGRANRSGRPCVDRVRAHEHEYEQADVKQQVSGVR